MIKSPPPRLAPSSIRTTRWRRLIRRKRIAEFLLEQSDDLYDSGHPEAAFALWQLRQNLRSGFSVGLKDTG